MSTHDQRDVRGHRPDQVLDPASPAGASTVTVRRGRHLGWWVVGRGRRGQLVMWTWWPSKRLADAIGRLVARLVRPVHPVG